MDEQQSEIRFNTRELIGLFIMLVVVSSLIFGLGVYVGKGMSETRALLFFKKQLEGGNATAQHLSSPVIPQVPPAEVFDAIEGAPPSQPVTSSEDGVPMQSEGHEVKLGIDREELRNELLSDEAVDITSYPYKGEMAKYFKDDAPVYSILLRSSPDKMVAEEIVKKLQVNIEGVFLNVSPLSPIDDVPQYRILVGRYHSEGKARSIAASLQLRNQIGTYTIERMPD